MGFGLRMNLSLGGSGGVVDTGPPSAIVNIPQFNVITDFTAPTVAAQQVAVATIPQFNVITNFTPPMVTTEAGDTAIYAATSYSISYLIEDGTFVEARNSPGGNSGSGDAPAVLSVGATYETNLHDEEYTTLDMNMGRGFLAFTIPSGAAYSTVQLAFNIEDIPALGNNPIIHIQQGSQATAYDLGEYDSFPSAPNGTSYGNTGAFTTTGTKTITLSAAGKTYVNGIRATGGTVKFVLRDGKDQANTAPTLDGNGCYVLITGSGGSGTIRPKLVVT